ncbi:MAG: tRNA (adenine(22)-N(1))-methyltransferase [Lachnospiraceae bacterium]
MTRLSKRLQAIAEMVTSGSRLADIGTDHGFLPLYLLEQGRIPSALAMDVNDGPLERAREHIANSNCQQYIETRLSDGLEKLVPGEVDTIVIAGMGGGLTVRILKKELCKLNGIKELILQPQSELQEVRKCLTDIGFFIVDEEMLVEDEKYYVVMRAVPKQEAEEYTVESQVPELLGNLYGPVLLRKKHPVLRQWLEREIGICQDIIQRLSGDSVGEKARMRKLEMEEKQKLLISTLNMVC